MKGKKKQIGRKITLLLLACLLFTVCFTGGISIYSLYVMKDSSSAANSNLGMTAAEDTKEALEHMAGKHLKDIAVEKAAYIEEKFAAVEAYVNGIAAQVQDIYEHPEQYPDREAAPPQKGSHKLAAQLLKSKRLMQPDEKAKEELLKLANIQDLLVQYTANNNMISSAYAATESGWLLQADYIAYSKYEEGEEEPIYYEADKRQWYHRAKEAAQGELIYTEVIQDIHKGGDCIVCAKPVYVNGKLVAVAGAGSYLDTVKTAVLSTAIGKTGYAFLVNEKGQIIVSGQTTGETAVHAENNMDLRKSPNGFFAEAAKDMVAGGSGVRNLTLDGKEIYLAYAPLHNLGWSFATVIARDEVVEPAMESRKEIAELTERTEAEQETAIHKTIVSFTIAVIAAAVLAALISMVVTGRITAPIRRLTKEVARLDGGNLDYCISIKTDDEIEDLGNAFNGMTVKMKQYVENLESVTAEKERIRTELTVAAGLQADMLPDFGEELHGREEIALYAKMKPAKEVGGDFYDFFLIDDNHLVLIMADVSGKGVPAALFMVVAKTLLRNRILGAASLAQAVEEVNNSLCKNNKYNMFVTAWIGILTLSDGILTFVNAGHNAPLLKKGNGGYEYLRERSGFVLAGMEESIYRPYMVQISSGDRLLLYTDGVTETHDINKMLYSEDRLKMLLNKRQERLPEETVEAVWKDLLVFQGGTEQFDDITLLALEYKGKESEYIKNTGSSNLARMEEIQVFVKDVLIEKGFPETLHGRLLSAADEIYSNICRYGEAAEVTVAVGATGKEARLYFEDDGKPYNPLARADPDLEKGIAERRVGGLGIYLVKKQMDEVSYEYRQGRNKLLLVKTITG